MAPKKHKVTSKKKGSSAKGKLAKKTRYFTFTEVTNIIDLKTEPLQIKQILPFGDTGKDEINVDLSLWEIQPKGTTDRGKPFEILQIKGKVRKVNKFKFEVIELKQKEEEFPKRKNKLGTDLWLPAKINVLGTDGKALSGGDSMSFVLPPLEYDETLELQLGCSIGKSVCGKSKVTWDSLPAVLSSLGVSKKTDGIPTGGKQYGKLKMIIIHSMCAINVVDKLKDSFEVDKNLQIFKDYGLSAHFIVDRQGKIIQAVDLNKYAWHAHGGNTRSIGIELIGFADDFRKIQEDRYEELKNKKNKESDLRNIIQKKLQSHNKSKADKKKRVKVQGKNIPVEEAISKCEKAIEDLDTNIEKLQKLIEEYEDWTKDKNKDKVPLVYTYTEKQYESIGKVLEVLSKRYSYKKVMSHHRLDKERKKDPGKYFEWDKILAYLPLGTLEGKEDGDGGLYTVN